MDNEHPRARLYYLFGAHSNPHGMPWLARVPAGLFAIPVGLFGLVGAWHRAAILGIRFADIIDAFLIWPAAVVWIAMLLLYAIKCQRHPHAVMRELQHPVQGSLMSLAPMSALLAAIHLGTAEQIIWLVITVLALAAHLALASRIISQLVTGRFPANAVTPALYLPLVGGCMVGAMALASLGYGNSAMAVFGAGMACWALLELRIMHRQFDGPLPASARTTIGIELVPPVVATLAAADIWPALPADVLLIGIGIAAVSMAFILARFDWWTGLPFSIGFWSFSFPLAALASVALETARRGSGLLWPAAAMLAFATAIILGLLVRTTSLLIQGRLLPAE